MKLAPPPDGPTRAEQERYWDTFPVTKWRKDFILPLPAMLRVAADVLDELHFGRGGHSYIAPSQYGKSTVIHHLLVAIPERFPHMRAVRLEFRPTNVPKQREFYKSVLRGLDPQLEIRHFLEDREDQALAEYVAVAQARVPAFIVFLVDEIQNCSEMVLEWLKYFIGLLNECGVEAVAFGFGNSGLTATVKRLREAHQKHLLKRYFREVLGMPGIRNRMALSRTFRVADLTWRWEPHGWTISQFYFPRAYRAGWRVTNESKLAWAALEKVSGAGSRSIEVGVDVIQGMLQYYLTQFSPHDDSNWKGTPTQWEEAVAMCDLSLLVD